MFIGEYNHTLDPKNRVIMPSKFREKLGDSFVMTKGLDNCLFIYSTQDWKIVEDKLKSLPMTNKDARAFVRFFLQEPANVIWTSRAGWLFQITLRIMRILIKSLSS